MAYNIEDASHMQELSLASYYGAPPFKIDRAVVRVLDNHGASHTCLYQIKLEGWTGNDEEHD
jgi:SUN domain-containing protein 1/2